MTIFNPSSAFLDPRIQYGESITKTLNVDSVLNKSQRAAMAKYYDKPVEKSKEDNEIGG